MLQFKPSTHNMLSDPFNTAMQTLICHLIFPESLILNR